jgi:hypothetical protein
MIRLYWLNYQHRKLYEKINAMDMNKKSLALNGIFDGRFSLRVADEHIRLYRQHTNTTWGKLKSFIPFTNPYACRCQCAVSLNKARRLINAVASIKSDNSKRKDDKHLDSMKAQIEEHQRLLPVHFPSPTGVNLMQEERKEKPLTRKERKGADELTPEAAPKRERGKKLLSLDN